MVHNLLCTALQTNQVVPQGTDTPKLKYSYMLPGRTLLSTLTYDVIEWMDFFCDKPSGLQYCITSPPSVWNDPISVK